VSHSINLKPRRSGAFFVSQISAVITRCAACIDISHRLLRRLGTGTGSPKGCANLWEYSEDGIVPNASDGSTGCNKVEAAG